MDETTFVDETLTCVECDQSFIFTAGEQQFFADKGLTNKPRRCKDCRAKNKARKQSGGKVETPVVCDQCGKNTTVPFVPSGAKPVLCRECFQPERSGRSTSRSRR